MSLINPIKPIERIQPIKRMCVLCRKRPAVNGCLCTTCKRLKGGK